MGSIDANCTACDLAGACKSVCIAADGVAERADVLFVGEAPDGADDEAGRPFVGQAGRLLRKALAEFGIDKYRVALTNTVKCCPPDGATPSVKQVRACSMYLEDEIAALAPRFIVPLGNVALRALTGKIGVTKYVGRQLPHKSGAVVFPMIHPASVFHDEARNQPTFEAGFEMLARALKGEAATTKNFRRVDLGEAIKLIGWLTEKKIPYAIDFETGPTVPDPMGNLQGNPRFDRIDCCALAWGTRDKDCAWFAWPRGLKGLGLLAALMKLLRIGGTMIAQQAVFETKHLLWHVLGAEHHDVRTRRWAVEDTLLFHHLIDENQSHGLEVLAAQYTDMGGYDNEVTLQTLEPNPPDLAALYGPRRTHHQIWLADPDALGRYCAGDTLATYKVWKVLRPLMYADEGLAHVWETITQPAVFAVAWAELNGRKVDFEVLERLRKKWTREADEALATVLDDPAVKRYVARREAAGRPVVGGFNPGSAQQVGDILFKSLRLPVLGTTEGGAPSIKAEYVEPYRKEHPWLDAYLTWKGRQKALEKLTEVEGLTAPDGYLYGSYLIHGTVTGRLASSNPNLQNFAKETRVIVVPREPDWVIVEADYEQAELRLFAWDSGCETLLRAFREGGDPHAALAARMYATPAEDVTKDQRFLGKTANFLLWNQGGPQRLRVTGGLTPAVAEDVYKVFHDTTPEARRYARKWERIARQAGTVRSWVGRLRRLPDIRSAETGVQRAAAREAGNAPVSGTASDLNTWAFVRVGKLIAEAGMQALPLGVTHDSGTYECPRREVPALAAMLRQVMTVEATAAVIPEIDVPFAVEIAVGTSWGALEVYDAAPTAVGR